MITEVAAVHPLVIALRQESSSWLQGAKEEFGELTIEISADRVAHICRYLKEEKHFERISTVTVVDLYPAEPRFQVVYHLHSISRNMRVRIKAAVGGESPIIETVMGVWPGAGWYEREAYDLFGITFRNHPDLRRIMMPDDWEGYPLRRDYPVHGHRYDYMERGGEQS